MSEISERQAIDIDRICNLLCQGLVDAAGRFCAYHDMRDEHDAPLASLILMETLMVKLLTEIFDDDQARHRTLIKMHKGIHATLRMMAQDRAATHPLHDDR